MPQTVILDAPARGLAGQIAEAGKCRYTRSYRAEDVVGGPINAGAPVLYGSSDIQCLAVKDADTVDLTTLAGFVILETSKAVEMSPAEEGTELSIMRKGTIYLEVSDTVAPGNPVFVGNTTATLGQVAGAAAAGLVEVPGCIFLTSADALGVAIALLDI